MNARSIHVRLITWYTALIIVTSIAFAGYTYSSVRTRLHNQLQDSLTRRVEHVRDDVLSKPTATNPQALTQQISDLYSPEASSRFIRISRTDGTMVYVSGQPKDGSFDPTAIGLSEDYSDHVTRHNIETRSGSELELIGVKATTTNGDYYIEMGANAEHISTALRKLIITLLIGLPFVATIAIIGGSLLVQRALQPVETIRATAEKITYSNLSRRLPVVPTGDAIEHLSITLNQMLGRLEHAYQQASRFSGDASHELRTPLTIIRSELESIEATMRAWQLPIEFRDRIGSVLEEAERLSGIVEGLFAVARLDAGEAKIEHSAFDLAALVRSTIEQVQLLAEEKWISVSIDAPESVFVMGDPGRLKQVVVNLLDNAIKYTPAGGAIFFAVHAEPSKAVLSVRDNGIGIPAEAQPYIFERFFRAGKDRSRAVSGAGLGLSIVRSICQAHGGTISVNSEVGTGTTFTIELPVTPVTLAESFPAAA